MYAGSMNSYSDIDPDDARELVFEDEHDARYGPPFSAVQLSLDAERVTAVIAERMAQFGFGT